MIFFSPPQHGIFGAFLAIFDHFLGGNYENGETGKMVKKNWPNDQKWSKMGEMVQMVIFGIFGHFFGGKWGK